MEKYEAPAVTVVGNVSDLTQVKPGKFFDYGHANEGRKHGPKYHS